MGNFPCEPRKPYCTFVRIILKFGCKMILAKKLLRVIPERYLIYFLKFIKNFKKIYQRLWPLECKHIHNYQKQTLVLTPWSLF